MIRNKALRSALYFLTTIYLFAQNPPGADAAIGKKVLELANKAVFEVVVLKPREDSIVYERALPLDLIPYQERTDKYISLGTAFAISRTELVTAAHVLAIHYKSQYTDFFVRDVNGNVYPVDAITRYSLRRDYAVFSVKNLAIKEFFPLNGNPELNGRVYAVGNALGEGIVIRDGLYTSNTPEELSGEWKWLRFSAAASPGNSGGPLLDEDGAVIGVVLGKSPSENLNSALPIREIMNDTSGSAHIHAQILYQLDNIPMTAVDTLDRKSPLPRDYRELHAELAADFDRFGEQLLNRLLSENRASIFPNGKEAKSLLNKHYHESFPRMIMKGPDGNWDAQAPDQVGRLELGNNGFIVLGLLKNSVVMRVQKPDDLPLGEFYSNSKVFMDTILKGLGVTRKIGPDKIKITSLGKADYESEYTDTYQRTWIIRTWPIGYDNTHVVTMTLPVPGGGVTLLRKGPTGGAPSHILDFKALADFIYVSYCGTLKDWREYLAANRLMPKVFSGTKIDFDYGNRLDFSSGRVAFTLTPANLQITENSELHLSFGYFNENNGTVWDIKEFMIGEDKNTNTNFRITRHTKPPRDLNDNDRSDWEKLVGRRLPYHNTSFFEENTTRIETVYGSDKDRGMKDAAVLYSLAYIREGTHKQEEMAAALDGFKKNVVVFEGSMAGESLSRSADMKAPAHP